MLAARAALRLTRRVSDRWRWQRLFISFFDSREAIEAAEAGFDAMGDTIPEEVRGRRTSVGVYEVGFDQNV